MVRDLLIRIVKVVKETDKGQKFDTFFGKFTNGYGQQSIEVRIAKSASGDFYKLLGNKSYLDCRLDIKLPTDDKNEVTEYDAFLGVVRKKNEQGRYVTVKNKEGHEIPLLVITHIDETRLSYEPLTEFDVKYDIDEKRFD